MAMRMQFLIANPVCVCSNGSNLTHTGYPLGFNPRMGKRVNFVVKCMDEERSEGDPDSIRLEPNPITPEGDPDSIRLEPNPITPEGEPQQKSTRLKTNPTVMPFPPKPEPVDTSFKSLFNFSERVTGRAAMIGFVAAIAVELSQGTDLLSQISDNGAQWFLATSIIISVISLVPLFYGHTAESKTQRLFNSSAELWNGRFAMLGLVNLALTEFMKGGALV